nr:hypothetical protein CFP56_13051 [Quercus suber]
MGLPIRSPRFAPPPVASRSVLSGLTLILSRPLPWRRARSSACRKAIRSHVGHGPFDVMHCNLDMWTASGQVALEKPPPGLQSDGPARTRQAGRGLRSAREAVHED